MRDCLVLSEWLLVGYLLCTATGVVLESNQRLRSSCSQAIAANEQKKVLNRQHSSCCEVWQRLKYSFPESDGSVLKLCYK